MRAGKRNLIAALIIGVAIVLYFAGIYLVAFVFWDYF